MAAVSSIAMARCSLAGRQEDSKLANVACEEVGWWFTTAFDEPEIKERMRELVREGAPMTAVVAELIDMAPVSVAPRIAMEFEELPTITLSTIVAAWAMADAAGKPFEVKSVRPEAPRDFARKRMVRVAIEAEEDMVRVVVSHVASRHAAWYGASAQLAS